MVAIVARFFLNVLAREGVAGKHATATALLLLLPGKEREDGGKCSLVGNAFKEREGDGRHKPLQETFFPLPFYPKQTFLREEGARLLTAREHACPH